MVSYGRPYLAYRIGTITIRGDDELQRVRDRIFVRGSDVTKICNLLRNGRWML